MKIYLRCLNRNSEEKRLSVFLSDPIPSSKWIGTFECQYKIEGTKISGIIRADDPFTAIRHACHAARISIAYRFEYPTIMNSKNEKIDISYEEIL